MIKAFAYNNFNKYTTNNVQLYIVELDFLK